MELEEGGPCVVMMTIIVKSNWNTIHDVGDQGGGMELSLFSHCSVKNESK